MPSWNYVQLLFFFYCVQFISGRKDSLLDGRLTFSNITHNSVVVHWPAKITADLMRDSSRHEMRVSLKRQNHPIQTFTAFDNKSDCSILIGKCRLTELLPGMLYEVTITFHSEKQEGDKTDVTDFGFMETKAKPIPDVFETIEYWTLRAALPCIIVIVIFVVCLLVARICGLCCWSKTRGLKVSSFKEDITIVAGHTENTQRVQNWVEEIQTSDMELSTTYDRPYLSPVDPAQGYTPFQTPQPTNQPCPPFTPVGGRSRIGTTTSESEVDLLPPVTRLEAPPSPHSNPARLPKQPPSSLFVQQLQKRQQQQLQQNQEPADEESHYNNMCVNTGSGNARRMFPHLL